MTTVASRKNKARNLQKKIVKTVLSRYPILTDKDVWSTPMGVNSIDIGMSQKARDLLGLGIEAKCQERLNIWSAIEQTVTNAEKENLTPLLVISRNRERMWAIVDFEQYMTMYSLLQVFAGMPQEEIKNEKIS